MSVSGEFRARIALLLVVAATFGVGMSILKGNDAGTRDDIGNLSAPWLLLPFFAGAAAHGRRWLVGAIAGLAATVTALTGFYASNAFVLDLGRHSRLDDLRLAFASYWFVWGLISGPVFGLLGSRWRQCGFSYAGVAVVALLAAEPLFWPLASRAGGVASFAFAPSLIVSAGEATVGLFGCACMTAAIARTRRRSAAMQGQTQPHRSLHIRS